MPTTRDAIAKTAHRIANLRLKLAKLEAAERKRVKGLKRAHRQFGFKSTEELIAALRSTLGKSGNSPAGPGHRLSPAQRKKLLAAVKSGAPAKEISKSFKIALSTAAYHISRNAPKRKVKKPSKAPAKPTAPATVKH